MVSESRHTTAAQGGVSDNAISVAKTNAVAGRIQKLARKSFHQCYFECNEKSH